MTRALDKEAEDRLLRWILDPDALEADLRAEREAMRQEWLKDPYFPIRNLRAHGTEPSEGALNTLDGPALCERCGASDYADGGELIAACESICYGCGHVICDRPYCQTPGWCVSKHPFSLHAGEDAA